MPRVTRGPRHSVKDRPGRLKLLLRRQRKLLRPLAWVGFATLIILLGVTILHSATPGGTLATLRERFCSVTALAGLRITDVVIEGRANTPEPLLRAALGVISEAVGDGYLVSCSWDGLLMRVAIGRRADNPDDWRKPWVMTFDTEADYSIDSTKLIADLVDGAKAWFGASKEQAGEIERSL
jgi:hypothetical protein